jgi:hypothetical protein
MLRRTLLAAALSGALASALPTADAQPAMHLSTSGTGQVLIYPYYTTHGGLTTVFTVANTTSTVKALKVRMLEGVNSKPALDFNLYLSPFATFAAAIAPGGDDGQPARILTQDRSCTVPAIPAAGLGFTTAGFTRENQDWDPTGTPPERAAQLGSPLRTRDGHIEVIEMGVLNPASSVAAAAIANSQGVPSNCAFLVSQWLPGGPWSVQASTNIALPGGGLRGEGLLVEAGAGLVYGYQASAIEHFYLDAAAPGALHSAPGSARPDLTSARTTATTVRVALHRDSVNLPRTETFQSELPRPDPVSLLWMASEVWSDYSLDPALGSETEWVFTMPTRRWYVDGAIPAAPFTNAFGPDGRSCALTAPRAIRRTGVIEPTVGNVGPPELSWRATRSVLCAATSAVAARNVASSEPLRLLRAREGLTGFRLGDFRGWSQAGGFVNDLPPGSGRSTPPTFFPPALLDDFDRIAGSGALRLGLTDLQMRLIAPSGRVYRGLPLLGLSFTRYINANAQPGVLANYSLAIPSTSTRSESGP